MKAKDVKFRKRDFKTVVKSVEKVTPREVAYEFSNSRKFYSKKAAIPMGSTK